MRTILLYLLVTFISFTGISQGADWFWRPLGENEAHNLVCKNKVCDGKTYETAWRLSSFRLDINPEGSVDLSQMSDGDTLYVCGRHFRSNYDNRLLVNRSNITVSGLCPGAPGSLEGSGIHIAYSSNIRILSLDFIGLNSVGRAIQFVGSSYIHIQDSYIQGYREGIASLREKDKPSHHIDIDQNTIIDVGQGITSANYSGSENNNWTIADNRIENVGKGEFQFGTVDAEAIGIQGGQGHRIHHNHVRNATYGLNLFACESHTVRDIRITDNLFTHITGGPSSWPSRGIFRSCFREADDHDRQYIRNNTIVNVDDDGIRWVCGNDATQCEISNNDVVLTHGIFTLGGVTVNGNVVVDLNTELK
jgi:hypothetical protein